MFEVKSLPRTPTLEVTHSPRMLGVPKMLATEWDRIITHMRASNIEQAGKPFARFHDLNWEQVRAGGLAHFIQLLSARQKLTIGIPVFAAQASFGSLTAGELAVPEGLFGVHRGPTHAVGSTYRKMLDEADRLGMKLANESVEIYRAAPTSRDQLDAVTEIWIPVQTQ